MTTEEKKTISDGIGCIVAIFMIPVTSILSGYVFSVLWGWFIVPVFHMPLLTIPQAIGISIIVNKLTYQMQSGETPGIWKVISFGVCAPLILLCSGWIVRMFL